MRPAHPTEREIGIEYYVSDCDGIGGAIRKTPEDFRVREIEAIDPEPLDADPTVYTHLLVRATLRNWDTHEFARELANRLAISRERINWAGTKDARALTTQLFSIDGVEPGDLPEIANATIHPIGRFGRALSLGDLAGNAFEITVTDPQHPENITEITEQLQEVGGPAGSVAMPNYFGHQRFGSRRPVTHDVGFEIVRGNWKNAVLTYVGNPSEAEPTDSSDARAYIEETEDWKGGLERLPSRLGYERAMLHRLLERSGETPPDFRAALGAVPENLQRLFVHAAQSYIFNRILSRRFEQNLPFDRAVPGDVVCFAEERSGLLIPDPDRVQRVTERQLDAINKHVERGRAFVTAPLVGTETTLGDGDPGEIERRILADLDLTQADFDAPEPFDSTGTRRAILVATELEVATDSCSFSFALPKGAYATVLLREYQKTDPNTR